MSIIWLVITSAVYIGLRAFQQLNVAGDKWLWIPPTTMLMALVEVYQLNTIIKSGSLLAAIPMAVGGVLGCWFSMWLHRRMRKEKQ